jgi:nucleoid-associated protein YgaU
VRDQLASQTSGHTALTAENQRLLAALQAAQADRAATAQLQTRLAEAERATARHAATVAELATVKEALATARTEAQAGGADRDSLNKLNAQLDSAGRTIADLSAKNDELAKDLEVSKQSIAAALAAQAAAAKAAPDGRAVQLEMQTLQDQVTKLETRLESERGTAAKELAGVATQLQFARETNRALTEANRALIAAKSSDDSVLRTERDQLDARVRELTASGTRLAEDKAAAERAIAEARKLAAAAGQERDTLRGQVDDMFSKLSESERRLTQFRQGSDSDRGQVASAQTAAEQARTALTALQAKFNENERALEQHNATVAELTGVNDRLTRERATLAGQVTAAQATAERARAELADLKSRHEAEVKAAGQQSATLAALIAADEKSTAKLAEVTAQVATLRSENTRLAASAEELAKLRAEAAEVKRKLAESDQAGDQQAASVAELTGANEKLSTDRREMQARIEALSGDLAQQRELAARLTQTGQTADAARREAEQRVSQLATAAEQLGAAQRELNAVRSENARLRETSTANERERTARMAQLQQDNAALAARLRQAQGTLDQIAAAARIINGTVGAPTAPPVAPVAPVRTVRTDTMVAAPAERFHTVQEGDSLTRISARYYGTPNRWQDIYEANRDVLRGENALRPGQRLRIP